MTAVEDTLAEFVVETTLDDLPDRTVEFTKHLLLKTTAGTVAGSRTPTGEMVARYVEEKAGSSARLLGTGVRGTAEDAALANGYFSHAAELEDDQFPVATSDITVVPVAYALADDLDLSGETVVESVALGMEVMNRVGSFPVTHLGIQDLSFYGVVGAQVAAANCYGFDVEQTRNLLGLGISQSSGWTMNFGTVSHYWESAIPCRNAITTAALAAQGADSNPDIAAWITGLLGDGVDLDRITDGLGEEWRLHETAIKKYPVCFLTHRQIDAMLDLLDRHEFDAEDVASVETNLCRLDAVVDRPDPTTIDDARFSIQHVLAVVLLRGDISYEDLLPGAVADPEVAALRSKVDVEVRDDWPDEFNSGSPHVTVTTTDGEVYSEERPHLLGGPEEPLGTDEIRALYEDILLGYYEEPLLSAADVERTADVVLDLEHQSSLDGLFETLTDGTR